MELRSRVKNLRELLICAGVYEEGMEVEEMRQVARAIELSTTMYSGIENSNMDRALMESEIDFQMMANSTMIVQQTSIDGFVDGAGIDRDSSCGSPVHMQVDAVVHHDQNWSPTSACSKLGKTSENDYYLKRTTSRLVVNEGSFDPDANPCNPVQMQDDAVVQHNQDLSPPSESCPISGKTSENDFCLKRTTSREVLVEDSFDPDATPISIVNSDSGVSCEVTGTLSSISESSSLPSIGEVPSCLLISTSSAAVSDQSEHEEHGPEFEGQVSH